MITEMMLNSSEINRRSVALVEQSLRELGVASSRQPPRQRIHLVATASTASAKIQVKGNAQPKPGGGKGKLALDWWIEEGSPADLVALADLSTGRVWLMTMNEVRAAAQQQSSGRYHLYMYTDPTAKLLRGNYDADFSEHLINRKAKDLFRLDVHGSEAYFEQATLESMVDSTANEGLRRQGFGLTAEERKTVELYAMSRAMDFLAEKRYQVKDVSASKPFDLEASRADERLSVEVKGSTGPADEVLLTRNEVDHQRRAFPSNALFVLGDVRLDRSTSPPKVSGGTLRWLHPWNIEDAALTPLAYSCSLPPV